MPTQTRSPTIISTNASGGTLPWSNTSNVVDEDAIYATVSTPLAGLVTSEWIILQGFGFSPPLSATNVKLNCVVKRKASVLSRVFSDPYSIENGVISQSIGASGNYTLSDTFETPLLPASIASPATALLSNFGIAFRLQFHDGDGSTNVIASIDQILGVLTWDGGTSVDSSGPYRIRRGNFFTPGASLANYFVPGSTGSNHFVPGSRKGNFF